jgi:hypothetical protein
MGFSAAIRRRVSPVASYAFNPASAQGYVYLPGRGDDAFRLNGAAMYHGHGFEGHWLRATEEWEKFARPLIAKAKATTARN